MPTSQRYSWVALRLCGETAFAGFSSQCLELPDGLPPAVDMQRGNVLEARLQTNAAQAGQRDWVLLGGPILRMHSQPSLSMRSSHAPESRKKRKLSNLCWVPPVSTLVAHYTGRELSCDDVLQMAQPERRVDEAEDPLEVLQTHWGIDCTRPFVDGDGAHSGGRLSGWEAREVQPLYVTTNGIEHVCANWWRETADALADGHPVFLMAERLEAQTVRHAQRTGSSYCHCLLVIGFEGSLADGPRSGDRRGAAARTSGRGLDTPPRLLIKDPCVASRLLEGMWDASTAGGGAMQLHVFVRESSVDRYRVKSTVRMSGVCGAVAAPPSPA